MIIEIDKNIDNMVKSIVIINYHHSVPYSKMQLRHHHPCHWVEILCRIVDMVYSS